MNTQPLSAEVLSGPVADLIAAVVEALDVPLPSIADADERAYHRLLERRVTDVRVTLAVLLKYPETGVGDNAAYIRTRTAAEPVTYTPFEPRPDGGTP
ncbi:hypothetical protein ACWF94_40780 [Streptomyces sp. NPDC055078]